MREGTVSQGMPCWQRRAHIDALPRRVFQRLRRPAVAGSLHIGPGLAIDSIALGHIGPGLAIDSIALGHIGPGLDSVPFSAL